MTADRAIYKKFKGCGSKAYYPTYRDAVSKGQFVYACRQCHGFHRTHKPLDARSQIRLIERIFGQPVTPELVTAFNELSSP